jgi:hypothetical protein
MTAVALFSNKRMNTVADLEQAAIFNRPDRATRGIVDQRHFTDDSSRFSSSVLISL